MPAAPLAEKGYGRQLEKSFRAGKGDLQPTHQGNTPMEPAFMAWRLFLLLLEHAPGETDQFF